MSRGPLSLFHAAAEREKEEAAKREHHVEMIKRGQVNIYEVEQLNKGAGAMLEQVISRLQTEMAAKQANAYVQSIGQQMIEFLQANTAVANQMTDDTKTLEGSYQAVSDFAKGKPSQRNMVTPQEAFEAIMRYYGVIGATLPTPKVTLPETLEPATETIVEKVAEKVEEPVKKSRFSASLDELL